MEELSLKELIEIVIKGKFVIAAVTAICILGSVVMNLFIIQPVYEAQTMLMISPTKSEIQALTQAHDADANNFKPLVDAIYQYLETSVDSYKEQVKATEILEYVRNEMNLKDIPLNKIASKITVDEIKNTNLITIKVADENPETAAKIANLVSDRFAKFVSESNQKQAENSVEFIESQMQKERENMENLLEEYKNFLSQSRSPEEVKMELDSKLEKL
ncbi:MAG TPA: Wzz/FepE/Etk N-terminal domain-containing protein [Acetivibrio sp.]|uniref:Wzz/FepE/Etk N-terminal domain-containing protein n=1 Tax=Acetivibrio sp. TaxID=1872092 RepID=UPI002BDC3D51|nr:Wzz/FepE/Etk N-terminal domain-containing protein [Acetivibrio sp.]HOM03055.1 Wzz/FepE/Etk N-terminal domain-containing protein [Acetivibrio sp.]